MSSPRDTTPRPSLVRGPALTTGARSRSVRDPTESLAPLSDPDGEWDPRSQVDLAQAPYDLNAPPELPLGTRDEPPRSANTRIDSPAARVRTPSTTRPPPPPRAVERADERIGQVLGAYRLLELIGKGGMGFVYRAEHARLGREVALKLLRADYAKRRDAVSRFFQEARTVNRVRHRNIVDVTDFIELEDGTTFIIMELLRGKSLGAWARGGFELPRALAALIQICDGLAAAHAVGVIHRDLKPDNVVIVPTADGAELVKLLDFGVAKLLNRDDEDVGLETAAGSVIGTPAYMSPEQAGGLVVDHRADIYSLGAIMYELFCGQPLFRGRSFGEYVRKHLNEQPVPPRDTPGGKHLDPRLESLLLRCLCKDPNGRYPHAEALRDDLLHLLAAIETNEHDLVALLRDSSVRRSAEGRGVEPGSRSSLRPIVGEPPPHARSTVAPAGYATMMAQGATRLRDNAHPAEAPAHGAGADPYAAGRSGSSFPAAYEAVYPGASYPGATPYPGATTPYPGAASWVAAPRRGRWMWGLGAAAVVGIGVAGALIAASSEHRTAAAPAAAEVPSAPAVTSLGAQPVQPAPLVKVAVDAPAGAHIEAVGSTLLLCTTPCTLVIDPADGGSTSRRDFVVKKDELRDAAFSIDLARPPPSIVVAMEALPPPIVIGPDEVDAVAADPGPRPTRTGRGARPDRTSGRNPGKDPAGRASAGRDAAGRDAAGRDAAGRDPTATAVTPPPDPVPVVTPPPDPTPAGKPGRKPRDPKVDPTATIDPFAPKR